MFENIIGQDGIAEELRADIKSGVLPQALLFHGPRYSGKLTAALELARVLTCSEGAALWDCDCGECERQRRLVHPFTLLMGARSFSEEIRACAEALVRSDRKAARYLFVRSVQKLLRRYDPVLWESSTRRLSSVARHLEAVSEALDLFDPSSDLPEEAQTKELIEEIVNGCEKIESAHVTDNIPVDQVRSMSFWTHTTSQESRKVVIMENVDRIGDSSRNALLKILEEPPLETYFILITERKEAVIPTIRSRLRHFAFHDRTGDQVQEVLSRVFREDSGLYASIREYFLAWDTSPEVLRNESRVFVESLSGGDPFPVLVERAPALRGLSKDRRTFHAFLEELSRTCRALLQSGDTRFSVERLYRWNERIRKKWVLLERLHVSADLLLESLYVEMREDE